MRVLETVMKMYRGPNIAVIALWFFPGLIFTGCGQGGFSDEAVSSYSKAREIYASGDLNTAEMKCREILVKSPDFNQVRILLAKCLFFLARYPEAEKETRLVLKKLPGHREGYVLLVRILSATGRTAEAQRLLDELLTADSSDPRLLYLRAQAALEKDDVALSLSLLKEASLFADEYALVFLDLARLYYLYRLEGQASRELAKALSLMSESSLLKKPVAELKQKIEKGFAPAESGGSKEGL